MDPSIVLQKTVKDNASELQNYMLDLKNWEEGAKKKERSVVYGIKEANKVGEKKNITREDVDTVKAAFDDGCRQVKNKKWDLAVSSFSKAIRKYDKNPAFFLKRAKCYLKLKKPDQAEEDCSRALVLDPKILKAKFLRSQAREMKGNLRGACLDLQDIVILDPSNQTAKNALNHLKPLYDDILKKEGYPSFIEEDSSNKTVKGESILESLAGSEDHFDSCAISEERIQHANIEKEKGNKFVKEEKWEEAKESYSKAIELNPNEPIFYANRALCFLKTKEEYRAILDCNMALKKNPRYVKVFLRRAAAKKATEDLWGARYDIKQVLSLEPNNSQAKIELEEVNLLIEKKESKETRFLTSEKKKIEPEESNKLKEYITLLPVNKPVNLRSKKPLKRIPIKFVADHTSEKYLRTESAIINCNDYDFNELRKDRDKKSLDDLNERVRKAQPSLEKTMKTGEKNIYKKERDLNAENNKINVNKEIKTIINSKSRDFRYVFPANKKPHLRSKKPLLRIPINFV